MHYSMPGELVSLGIALLYLFCRSCKIINVIFPIFGSNVIKVCID